MRSWILIGSAGILTLPAFWIRFAHSHVAAPVEALLFGLAVVGAAFLLSWAAEVAQLDMSQGLSLALLALITVLPEYGVSFYFTWSAGVDPAPNSAFASYTLANMTGANRLLVGLAWPLVVLLSWFRSRRPDIRLGWQNTTEIAFMAVATLYSFTIPLKGYLSLVDAVVLGGLFCAYVWRISRQQAEEPELIGPAATIGALEPVVRRYVVIALALFSAFVICIAAEPFADALIETGKIAGIDEFLLVQWLAPLASEAPEFVIVCLFTWHLKPVAGLGALVSSKVNQWTLLVGSIPLVYTVAHAASGQGFAGGMDTDLRQEQELLLTAAQSLFAVALLARLRLSLPGAIGLLVLFVAQLATQIIIHGSQSTTSMTMLFAWIYLLLAVVLLVRAWRFLLPFLGAGLFGRIRDREKRSI